MGIIFPCVLLHIYLHSVCFPILSFCGSILLFCIVFCHLLSSLQRISSHEQILSPHSSPSFSHLYVYASCVHRVAGGKCTGNKAKIQVCTCISAIPFSGVASANGHGNTLQQNVTPKSKRDHSEKQGHRQAREGLPSFRDTFIAAYLRVFLLPRGGIELSSESS